ncbi:SRPBCC family protein [Haloarcula marina]|uniref:SRPBCC family protein n=1 Tax=Haloarcula marina TaxID=2961574 RepID=UPI0020B7B83E|nr:SRPBCC family protein [Halomicroarcula marina]
MRTVERTRFVDATPAELDRLLSPSAILEHEGTFSTVESTAGDEGTRVTARGGGVEAMFAFQTLDDGFEYRQVGQRGPFEFMETTLTYAAENHGSEVRVRSTVSLGLPLPALSDRLAAWKRRGELDRLLDGLAAEV